VPPPRHVTIRRGWSSETFTDLYSLEQIDYFGTILMAANGKGIKVDGIDGSDHIVKEAVAAVYGNVVARAPNCRIKKQTLALTLWKLQSLFFSHCLDAAIYCLNELNKIAPTAFEKSKLLLSSQCNPIFPDDFIPLPKADWSIIADAVRMLITEPHEETSGAAAFLEELKDTPLYETLVTFRLCENNEKMPGASSDSVVPSDRSEGPAASDSRADDSCAGEMTARTAPSDEDMLARWAGGGRSLGLFDIAQPCADSRACGSGSQSLSSIQTQAAVEITLQDSNGSPIVLAVPPEASCLAIRKIASQQMNCPMESAIAWEFFWPDGTLAQPPWAHGDVIMVSTFARPPRPQTAYKRQRFPRIDPMNE
jgi:hypothetical protein